MVNVILTLYNATYAILCFLFHELLISDTFHMPVMHMSEIFEFLCRFTIFDFVSMLKG
jgi:hypothetical protein